jgi:hypothetical protein
MLSETTKSGVFLLCGFLGAYILAAVCWALYHVIGKCRLKEMPLDPKTITFPVKKFSRSAGVAAGAYTGWG